MSKRGERGKNIGVVSLGVNLALFVAKLIVGIATNSLTMIADGFNNLADCSTNIITFLGFSIGSKVPDQRHQLGHGRIEYLGGMIVALVILFTAASVGKTAWERIISPEVVTFSWSAVVVCVIGISAKLGLALYLHWHNRSLKSTMVTAGIYDSIADTLATSLALLTLVLVPITSLPLDGYAGLIIGLFILATGLSALRANADLIIGLDLTEEEKAKIIAVIMAEGMVEAVEELHSHDFGVEKKVLVVKVRPRQNCQFFTQVEKYNRQLKNKFGFDDIYWLPSPPHSPHST